MIPIVYLSFAFAISEFILMLVKRSKSGSSRTRDDRGSLILLWTVISIGFTGGFFLSKPMNNFWSGFGFALIISGLIVRWISILQLGKSFTVDVAITNSATLITDGIYERVRHPSYSGLLSVVAGFAFTMSSLYSFLVFVIPVFLAINYRIKVEEKILIDEFGDSYKQYMKKTKRLIASIW
jgi:protein-S-isoprenylcysteine O-methyltransferase Ste14